ncbi:MAG: lysophospholipid acyltransferase family protein [Gemmatimonadaceae bacterium]|nr:lysophospholipid acyltransferase family protein [Acetobacteraceae bacterium]
MPERRRPDPIALRSDRAFLAFGWYLRWYFYRSFHAVRMSRSGLPTGTEGRPVIVYGNHPAWWDPALYILLCALLFPKRQAYGPMDSKALGHYGVFERMGVFGVDVDSPRGAAQFLTSSLQILAQPGAMLWVTAEGEFADIRRRPLQLRPGIAHLARRVPNAVILPLAAEYTFWNESKPEALVRFGAPIEAGPHRSVAEWTEFLQIELAHTMDGLAAESIARTPAHFETLVRGGAGVGGVYDLYRRGRALIGGRRFDPRHEQRE